MLQPESFKCGGYLKEMKMDAVQRLSPDICPAKNKFTTGGLGAEIVIDMQIHRAYLGIRKDSYFCCPWPPPIQIPFQDEKFVRSGRWLKATSPSEVWRPWFNSRLGPPQIRHRQECSYLICWVWLLPLSVRSNHYFLTLKSLKLVCYFLVAVFFGIEIQTMYTVFVFASHLLIV